jgi:uncharacterized protein
VQQQTKFFHQHLIIFTRYPEANHTKTRMIPLLGAVGAANLQRQMTEHTLATVKRLQVFINQTFVNPAFANVSVEVRFAGGNLQLMQAWLGDNLIYQPQGEGDLGDKMMRSLSDSFHAGAKKTIIIGTDCPGINSQLLNNAFAHLDNFDLTLGPAIDGGYYLIGLRLSVREVFRELFQNINWGTSQVFQQTVDIAQKLKLSSIYLQPLADVDRPEDLEIWEKVELQR